MLLLLLTNVHSVVVTIDYGYSHVVACPGDTVHVQWSGYHNIRETTNADCSSDAVGSIISDYRSSGATKTFFQDELVAQPGGTRFFKCDQHCSASNARFEVSCPASPPPPSTPLSEVVCIEDKHRVLTVDNGYVALKGVTPGMQLRTANGSITTVVNVVSQHSTDTAWVVPAETCGSKMDTVLSPHHAVWCHGQWTTAPNVGKLEPTNRAVHYMNLQTTDYCSDLLILDTGLVVETWDGRGRQDWRPHSYLNGERVGCITRTGIMQTQ